MQEENKLPIVSLTSSSVIDETVVPFLVAMAIVGFAAKEETKKVVESFMLV